MFCTRTVKFSLMIAVFITLLILNNAQAQKVLNEKRFIISTDVGYFREDFRWSIAGNTQGTNPNIYSELRWKELAGPQAEVDIQYRFWKKFIVQGNFSHGWINSGRNTDTDFGEDNRTDTLYFGSYDGDKGNVFLSDVSIGCQFMIGKKTLISPYIGYTESFQRLYILGDLGNITGELKSTYQTRWNGLAIGFKSDIFCGNKFLIQPSINYYQVYYRAKANWNLIEEYQHPVSFRHKAIGYGIEPQLRIHYIHNEFVSIFIGVNYSHWKTGKGIDTLYRSNGSISTTQMNGAFRNNYAVSLGGQFSF